MCDLLIIRIFISALTSTVLTDLLLLSVTEIRTGVPAKNLLTIEKWLFLCDNITQVFFYLLNGKFITYTM